MDTDEKKIIDKSSVRSLTRGLEILECFSENNSTLSLTDISKKTGLSISTLSRLLNTLVHKGYLSKDTNKKYMIGNQMYKLMRLVSNTANLRTIALPILENLRDIFDETASLYIVSDKMRVCVESLQSHQALRRSVEIGEILPLTRGAVGYVLLSWLPYTVRKKISKENPHLNEVMFSDIRKAGYVINDGLHEPGVFAIAAPVFNGNGVNLAAISVSGPSYRINEPMKRELTKSIKNYSGLISKALGYIEIQ